VILIAIHLPKSISYQINEAFAALGLYLNKQVKIAGFNNIYGTGLELKCQNTKVKIQLLERTDKYTE
jgi:hypothetical protein